MIIGLNGRLKSGKDTTFKIIQELYPHAERVSFADKLKRSAAAALGVTLDQLEEWKNDEEMTRIEIGRYIEGQPAKEDLSLDVREVRKSLTVREYLQWYGTEAHREIFGENFWVDAALPMSTDHHRRLLVVTDMRFPNEVYRVKDLSGICVKVERSIGTETKFSSHASEQDVDYLMDFFLDNNGSLNDLRINVHKFFLNEVPQLKNSKTRMLANNVNTG